VNKAMSLLSFLLRLGAVVFLLVAAFKAGFHQGRTAAVADQYIETVVKVATTAGVEQGFIKGLQFRLNKRI
jgi:hypothetical protein